MNKYAGGGARTFKSFRRTLERTAKFIADSTGRNSDEVLGQLYQKTRALRHVPDQFNPEAKGLLGKLNPKQPTFLSYGGWYTDPLKKGGPVHPREDVTLHKGQIIRIPDIRKMRGKFSIDPNELEKPGIEGNSLVFRGKIPKNIVKERFGRNSETPFPTYLILTNNPKYLSRKALKKWQEKFSENPHSDMPAFMEIMETMNTGRNRTAERLRNILTRHDKSAFKNWEGNWANYTNTDHRLPWQMF